MSDTVSGGRGGVRPASGIKHQIQARTQARRRTQAALAEIGRPEERALRNDLFPRLAIQYAPIDSLRPAVRRVRRADKAQAARLDRSLAAYGLCAPLIVDADKRIVHGHGMWEAARRAGLTDIPVVPITHLTPSQTRALAIAFNRLSELAEWDEDALRLEFCDLIQLEDLTTTGFEVAELDGLMMTDTSGEEDEADAVPKPASQAVSRPGDLRRLQRARPPASARRADLLLVRPQPPPRQGLRNARRHSTRLRNTRLN